MASAIHAFHSRHRVVETRRPYSFKEGADDCGQFEIAVPDYACGAIDGLIQRSQGGCVEDLNGFQNMAGPFSLLVQPQPVGWDAERLQRFLSLLLGSVDQTVKITRGE